MCIRDRTKALKENTKAKTENAQAALKGNKKFNSPVSGSDKKDKDKKRNKKETDLYDGKKLIANATDVYKRQVLQRGFHRSRIPA